MPTDKSNDPLLKSFSIRHLHFRNRILSTSHACGLEDGGLPTAAYQAYHEEKAKGGLALTMFGGSSNVSLDSPNVFRQLYIGNDAIVPYLQEFSARIHAAGAKIMCQITHLGRRGESFSDNVLPTVAPSMVRETLHRSFPKVMDKHDIHRVINDYASAALRCKQGGLDGIETLAGAHLIGQFLSPVTNQRYDEYGGTLENRCRFGLEVYDAIRQRVGDDFVVGFRFHVDEGYSDGLDFNHSLDIAHRFEQSGLIDFFNANYGRMDTIAGLAMHNMPGMAAPLAPWLQSAGKFKQAVGLPVFHAARINDLATARHAISEGLLDMVAMTRAHIADPHIVKKIEQNQSDRIRPCVGATHCMGGTTRPSCLHNPVTGRETVHSHTIVPLTSKDTVEQVVVIGGGPAGLEAARIAAERKHHVVLFEAAPELGGQVQLAVQASWRKDLRGVIDWRQSEIERLGVDVRLNQYADKTMVERQNPDIVIIATGGVPDIDWIEHADLVTSAWDILAGQVPAAASAIVYDGTGRHVAPTVAEALLGAGSTVELFSIDDHFGMEMAYAEQTLWRRRCYEIELPMVFNRRLIRVERHQNQLAVTFRNELTDVEQIEYTDQLVVEHGTMPADELYKELVPSSVNKGVTNLEAWVSGMRQPVTPSTGYELYRIGDAVSSRNIHTAILDAHRLLATR